MGNKCKHFVMSTYAGDMGLELHHCIYPGHKRRLKDGLDCNFFGTLCRNGAQKLCNCIRK